MLVVLAVALARWALLPLVGSQSPLLPFLVAVYAAAFIGGRGPALFVTVVSPPLATLLFTEWPAGQHPAQWSAHIALFLAMSVVVSLVMDKLQKAYASQRAALEAMHEAERLASTTATQLHLITDSLPVLIAYLDRDRCYRFANQHYDEWFGGPHTALIGQHASIVLGKDIYRVVEAHIERALAGEHVSFEALLEYGSQSRYVFGHYIPDVTADGHVRGVVSLVQDISERKQAQEQLLAADRRKDEFLAILAHELRNPLATIRNVCYVLASEKVEIDKIRRLADMLDRQSARLTRLVDDLLDVARITRGVINLRMESVSLQSIISQAIETVEQLVQKKQQIILFRPPSQDVTLLADPVRLCQVFENLLANASKFSPERATIEIFIERMGPGVAVHVKDEGRGIEAEFLPHIFEPLSQTQPSHFDPHAGLGIGLTIVKRLVELHGGSTEAKSAGPGRGAELIVRLPLQSPSVL